MSTLKAQVMLVDDHAMLRHGMAMLINAEPDMEVFAEAGDGDEGVSGVLLKRPAIRHIRVGRHLDEVTFCPEHRLPVQVNLAVSAADLGI